MPAARSIGIPPSVGFLYTHPRGFSRNPDRPVPEREGGHGGADGSLQDLLFRNEPAADPLGLRADLRAGALASLIGIAARHSIERAGQPVAVGGLVRM